VIAGERLGHLDHEGGADSADWRAAWGGGLVTTCGLDNRAEGRLPFLEPGQERSTRIVITSEEMR
jgi:hypothetical protein